MAEEALGVERSRAESALAAVKKRKRSSSLTVAPRKRATAEVNAERAKVRKAWRNYAFSIAYSALNTKNPERVIGPKEKEALSIMKKQISLISSVVRARWRTFGSPGHHFTRSIVQHYERSVISVRVELVGSSDATASACELHCAIAKQPISAVSARRVFIRYRGTGGVIRDAIPIIVGREWAERIEAWFDLVLVDERIVECVRTMDALADEELTLPKSLLERWKGMRMPTIAQVVAQDVIVFERYCRAIAVWLDYPANANVWPGWFK